MSGRNSPRNALTTALPREGRMTKQALSAWWKTQIQKVCWPTRTLVSSAASTVPDSRCCLIRLVWAANAGALSASRWASAPSLISSPNRSCIRRARRSNGMACPKRRYRTKAGRLAPNGDPGSSPAGAVALPRLAQHGQTPPCSVTRVTSGVISGISMRSYACTISWATPITSAWQGGTAPPARRAAASDGDAAAGARRRGPGLGLRLAVPVGFAALGGRRAGVVRGLGRKVQLRFRFGHPRRQHSALLRLRVNLHQQRGAQRVLSDDDSTVRAGGGGMD